MTPDEAQVSLKEHIEVRIRALEKATEIAASQMEKRLDGMNEFRQQLKDQEATYLTRTEYQTARGAVERDIRMLLDSKATLDGKASQQALNVATVISIAALVMALLGLLLRLK